MSNDQNEKDIKFAERTKPTPGDLQPEPKPKEEQPVQAEQPPQGLQLRPFKDGIVLRHSVNPRNPRTRVLHDSTGTPLAVCLFPEIADMICNAVTFLFIERERVRQEQLKQLDEMSVGPSGAVGAEGPDEGKPFVPIAPPDLKVVPESAPTDKP